MRYIIKNIDKGTFIEDEHNGKIKHTRKEENALIFNEEWDAESTLYLLNERYADCYSLVEIEDEEDTEYEEETDIFDN